MYCYLHNHCIDFVAFTFLTMVCSCLLSKRVVFPCHLSINTLVSFPFYLIVLYLALLQFSSISRANSFVLCGFCQIFWSCLFIFWHTNCIVVKSEGTIPVIPVSSSLYNNLIQQVCILRGDWNIEWLFALEGPCIQHDRVKVAALEKHNSRFYSGCE